MELKKLTGLKCSVPSLNKTFHVKDNVCTFSNIEMFVRFPLQHPNGVYDKFSINKGGEDSFPEFPSERGDLVYSGDFDYFLTLLEYMYKFTSTDVFRPMMCGVKFEKDGVCVSTDAHILRSVSLSGIKKDFFIPNMPLIDIKKIAKEMKDTTINIYSTNRVLLMVAGRLEIAVYLPDGQYPSWRAVIPISETKKTTIETSKIDEFMKASKANDSFGVILSDGRLYMKGADTTYAKVKITNEVLGKEKDIPQKDIVLIMSTSNEGLADYALNPAFIQLTECNELYWSEGGRAFVGLKPYESKAKRKVNKKDLEIQQLKERVQELEAELKKYK